VISAAKNSNKFQKTRFLKEKSVEDVVTLGPMAQATLVFMNIEINFLKKKVIFKNLKSIDRVLNFNGEGFLFFPPPELNRESMSC
jgi:hypothetical protein